MKCDNKLCSSNLENLDDWCLEYASDDLGACKFRIKAHQQRVLMDEMVDYIRIFEAVCQSKEGQELLARYEESKK
jgi:hypothetical protein